MDSPVEKIRERKEKNVGTGKGKEKTFKQRIRVINYETSIRFDLLLVLDVRVPSCDGIDIV